MTDAELQAIKARCDAATQGPWDARCDWDRLSDDNGIEYYKAWSEGPVYNGTQNDIMPNVCADAAFIAAARTDIPALLTEIAQLRFIVTEYREGMRAAKGALNAETHRADVAEQELERLRHADRPKPKPPQPSEADTSRG